MYAYTYPLVHLLFCLFFQLKQLLRQCNPQPSGADGFSRNWENKKNGKAARANAHQAKGLKVEQRRRA